MGILSGVRLEKRLNRMILIAGKDNKKLNNDNAIYIDGYNLKLPKNLIQAINEYDVKFKMLWADYVAELRNRKRAVSY